MNLLLDPIFRVRLPEQSRRVSLPQLLALLGEDRIDSLPGLQRHQADALHVFLCYLAGAVLDRQGAEAPCQDAEFWLEGIRALTRAEGCDNDDAWTLVVENPTRPAFLQPPAPSITAFRNEYKPKAATPAALDVLQTAKNHDVKASRGDRGDAEAWCFALLTLQTQTGYLGNGNYGITRMNGGDGSRSYVAWQIDRRPGVRFLHELPRLLAHRQTLLAEPHPYTDRGQVLLWLPAWDGKASLSLATLDPFFIEIARRVRLIFDGADYQAVAATSGPRVAAKEQKGNLGDPWIPINRKTDGALTVQSTGFTPELLRKLLFGGDEFTPAAMQEAPVGPGAGWFSATVLVRGKGTTDGFHEAVIRVPEKVRPVLFGKGPTRDRLAVLSRKGLEMASNLQYRVLQPALFAFLEGGPDALDLNKREVGQWVSEAVAPFVRAWDPRYFDWLWTTLDQADDATAMKAWFDTLRPLAEACLEGAFTRTPLRSGRTYRARSRAKGMFHGALKKHFQDYLEPHHEHA